MSRKSAGNAAAGSSRCPHVDVVQLSWEEINAKQQKCDECNRACKQAWLCLHQDCEFVGCGEKYSDHSSQHQSSQRHPLCVNLRNKRFWCSACNAEVFERRNTPPFVLRKRMAGFEPLATSGRRQRLDSSSEEDDEPETLGLTGLRNLGNTCYMSAAVQALSNCQQLTRFFLDCPKLAKPGKFASKVLGVPVSSAYGALIAEIWSARRSPCLTPSLLAQSVRQMHPAFKSWTQQDSQEFLRCFMDQLHEELKRPVLYESEQPDFQLDTAGSIDAGDARDSSDEAESGESEPASASSDITAASRRRGRKFKSVISDIFNGSLISTVQCNTCERLSSTVEIFQDLSLPIPSGDHLAAVQKKSTNLPGSQSWLSYLFWPVGWLKGFIVGPRISLQDCLDAFFSYDDLKGDNMYRCGKCEKLRNGVKFSKLCRLPEMLTIHLKRFRHDFMLSSKISSYVSFPIEGLDMKRYLHRDCRDRQTSYDLTAVVCHHGSAAGGHYTAYALNHCGQQWYEFDDSDVRQVDVAAVESSQAYVLFYRKRDDGMLAIRQKAMEIIESSEEDSSLLPFYISRLWVNKFNTFGEPGPISNEDFLCPHQLLSPHYADCAESVVMPVPHRAWELLLTEFGGGPTVNRLSPCPDCTNELEQLRQRAQREFETFKRELKLFQQGGGGGSEYAISMRWYRSWEAFARQCDLEPPGPIDNSSIVLQRRGACQLAQLRPSSDHANVSGRIWKFFFGIYGGGPEVRVSGRDSTSSEDDDEEEDNEGDREKRKNEEEQARPAKEAKEEAGGVKEAKVVEASAKGSSGDSAKAALDTDED